MIRKLPDCTVQLSLFAVVTLIACSLGCGQGESPPATGDRNATASARLPSSTTANAQRHGRPEQTVTAFLEALKVGDDVRATSLLTAKARQEMERANAAIKPPGSPTAEFKVTEVEFVGDSQDGAHVLSSWIDTNLNGNRQSYEIVWILRQDDGGWAIAGMATKVFDDQQPLILNFEDPVEAQQKRQAVDEEIARRQQEAPTQQTPAQDLQVPSQRPPVQQARQPESQTPPVQR
jgi:hypothetical protein